MNDRLPVTPKPPDRPLSAAFGGGGVFGIAYGLGVAHALIEAGVPLMTTPTIGTSAGAWVAACIATDRGFAELRDLPDIRVPDATPGLLQNIATTIFGDATSALVTASAVQLPTMRHVLLPGDSIRLADLVAASSSVPGIFRPASFGGTSYVDGGVRSLVSADHAAPARHLLVIAPIAGPMFGPAGRIMQGLLGREIRRWENATNGKAHLIRPNAEIASLARHPLQLFDKARAAAAYPLARAQTENLLRRADCRAALTDIQQWAA